MENLSVKRRIVVISNKLRVSKDGNNEFGHYEYFKPDDILRSLNPLLEEYNLITMFNMVQANGYYTATLVIEDVDSPEKVEFIFDIDKAVVKGGNPAQGSGATLTYAKRYLLMNCFNIADDTLDPDSSETQKNAPETQPKSQKNQYAQLFTMAKQANISKDDIDGWINTKFGKTSIRELTKNEYNELLQNVAKNKIVA